MKTVLIADDALFMRMMLKDLLTKNEFNVIGEAENGQEAFEKYKELKPDIALLDILMPIMDGITAVEKIRQFDPEAKIVMISAMGQQDFYERAEELGVKSFILKPFSPPRVIETLNEIFEES